MSNYPQFSYFISHQQSPVTKSSTVWHQPLSLSRKYATNIDQISIDHGEYFDAIRSFLEKDGCKIISRVCSQQFNKIVKPTDIGEIRICLEKHGEFYHPARVETLVGHQNLSFVLNVAVSEVGIRSIKEDYHNLKKLGAEYALSFLPQVYGYGQVRSAGNHKICMFLGQWFEGYNEFHISKDPIENEYKIRLWNDSNRRFFLSPQKAKEVYRQIAKILTHYYNVETFEQIFAWHHAAGDFIVRVDHTGLDVKLITVRRYGDLFQNSMDLKNAENNVELILQALLIFFLNLSIRIRLDRLDGVGDIVWADKPAVQSTLVGFLEALALKPRLPSLPDSIDQCFKYYLSVCTKEDVRVLCEVALNTFNRKAPEISVIKQRLSEHIEALNQAIDSVRTS